MNPKLKWYTVVEYVDIETGELISKSLKERKYYVIRKTKKVEVYEYQGYGITKWTAECRRNGQQRLF